MLRKNFDFGKNFETFRFLRGFRIISILVKISINCDLGQSIRKLSIFSKISKNFDFFSLKFRNNIDFGQIFEKFRFFLKFRKIRFWSTFRKNLNFGQNFENVDFFENFEIFRFRVKFSNNFDLGQIFENFSFLVKNLRKISIHSKIPKNFDLGQIFRKFLDFD